MDSRDFWADIFYFPVKMFRAKSCERYVTIQLLGTFVVIRPAVLSIFLKRIYKTGWHRSPTFSWIHFYSIRPLQISYIEHGSKCFSTNINSENREVETENYVDTLISIIGLTD